MHATSSAAPFRKRTFSLPRYARSLAAVAAASPVLVRALVRPRISRALREQVVLAVTSVNDCRYCNWGHTTLAPGHGEATALRLMLAKRFAIVTVTLEAECEPRDGGLKDRSPMPPPGGETQSPEGGNRPRAQRPRHGTS